MSWKNDRPVISSDGEEAIRDVLADMIEQKPTAMNLEAGRPEQGLAQLVLTIIELLRRLLEQEALRQIEYEQLSEEQIERVGNTFAKLDTQMHQLLEVFGLTEQDLNLDLGPLGTLM
jgi:hypothetical protein